MHTLKSRYFMLLKLPFDINVAEMMPMAQS